jgi:maltooligosyltrehalose trehalohydrolase
MDFNTFKNGIFAGNIASRCSVWAPFIEEIDLHVVSPFDDFIRLNKDSDGYHTIEIEAIQPGCRYFYRLNNGIEYPDPASRFQPEGVLGPSEVTVNNFEWTDFDWKGPAIEDYIIYELHTGCFSPQGNFKSTIPYLDRIKDLGITALEIMPVAQFPGARNWGYDGVFPFAVHNSYGGPDGLKYLINECHNRNLAVILDVVYNHLGPEGNYFEYFGPYFTDRYSTPWGKAINFDGSYSDDVRRFFIENSLYWVKEFHIDALRLDALHAVIDMSSYPFLRELSDCIKDFRTSAGRNIYLIGESDANDRKTITSAESGGFGIDAQWNEDFHHSLHTVLTDENNGYYQDFGSLNQLAKAYKYGFAYYGQYSKYRKRRHGSPSNDIKASKFVVFIQNHDQVGNRFLGERLSRLVSFEKLKLAAGIVILSPYIPLFFMGEEYGETAPFLYFIDHSDPSLIEAVKEGRKEEFKSFSNAGDVPAPQNPAAFMRSKLNHDLTQRTPNNYLLSLYKELIRLRRNTPPLCNFNKTSLEVSSLENEEILYVRRWENADNIIMIFNFSNNGRSMSFPVPPGQWQNIFDSRDERFGGEHFCASECLYSKGESNLTIDSNSFLIYRNIPQEA